MGVSTIGNGSRGRLWRSRWAAIGAAVAITFGAGGLVAVNAAGGVDSTTVLTDPVRVLDSRDPVNVGLSGPFESQSPQQLKVTGSIQTTTGTKTVAPTGATGVLLNVTAVAPEADGFISIRPGDATGLPTTSSLNVAVGEVLANAVLVALPTSGTNAGQIDITWDAYGFLEPRTDILIDVVGYTNNSTLAALQAEIDAAITNSGGAAYASSPVSTDMSPGVARTVLTLDITVPTAGVLVVNGNANVNADVGIAVDCWINIDSAAKNSAYGVQHLAAGGYVDVWADNVGFDVTAGRHTLYLGCQQMNGLDSDEASIQVRSMTAVFSTNSILD